MSIFVLIVSAGVLFDGAFSLLSILNCLCEHISKRSIRSSQGSIFTSCCIEFFLKFFLVTIVKTVIETDEIQESSDYRAISVLFCFSKMLECIMYNLFNNYFEKELFLKQFGFQKNLPTDVIDQVMNHLKKAIFCLGLLLT